MNSRIKDSVENLIKEARRFMGDTLLQFREECTGEDELYWQGRKDATRLMMAMIIDNLGEGENGDWLRDLVKSSPNSTPLDRELANSLLEDAVYNVSAILYEMDNMKKVDARTKRNLVDFVKRYDYLAQQGKFPIIDNHC